MEKPIFGTPRSRPCGETEPRCGARRKPTSESRMIAQHANLSWPRGEKGDELGFIQTSLDNYRAFLNQLCHYRGDVPSDSIQMRVIDYVLQQAPSPCQMVTEWLAETHALFWKSRFNPRLRNYVLTPDQERFRRWCRGLCEEYGDEKYWKLVWEALGRTEIT